MEGKKATALEFVAAHIVQPEDRFDLSTLPKNVEHIVISNTIAQVPNKDSS
jgi:hypothetical protein